MLAVSPRYQRFRKAPVNPAQDDEILGNVWRALRDTPSPFVQLDPTLRTRLLHMLTVDAYPDRDALQAVLNPRPITRQLLAKWLTYIFQKRGKSPETPPTLVV